MFRIVTKAGQASIAVALILALGQTAQAQTLVSGTQVDVQPIGTPTRLYNAIQGAHDFEMGTNGSWVVGWKGEGIPFNWASQSVYKQEYSGGVNGSTFLTPTPVDASRVFIGDNGFLNTLGMDRAGNYTIAWEMRDYNVINAAKFAPGGGATPIWSVNPFDGFTTTPPADPQADRRGPNIAVYSGGSGAFLKAGRISSGQHNTSIVQMDSTGANVFGGLNGSNITSDINSWTTRHPHSDGYAAVDSTRNVVMAIGASHPGDGTANKMYAKVFDDATKTYTANTKVTSDATSKVEGKEGTFLGMPDAKWLNQRVTINDAGVGVFVFMKNSDADLVTQDTTGDLDVYARRFTLAGTAITFVGSDFLVNTATTGDQFAPDVDIDDNGYFTIAWQDDDRNIYGKVYKPDGTVDVDQFMVNTTPATLPGAYFTPQVSMALTTIGDGSYAAFGISYTYDGSSTNGASSSGTLDQALYVRTFELIPEPSTVMLVGLGLIGLVGIIRRRRQS